MWVDSVISHCKLLYQIHLCALHIQLWNQFFLPDILSPFGAKESVKKRKFDQGIISTTKSFPNGVVEALEIPENFDSNVVVIEVENVLNSKSIVGFTSFTLPVI